jgi:hypothetical protein
MESIGSAKLDIAYKYPFTAEAKEIVSKSGNGIDKNLLKLGRIRVEESINSGRISFTRTSIEDTKLKILMSYVYARLISSAISKRFNIRKYASSEALRSGEAFLEDSNSNAIKICGSLGINARERKDGTFEIPLLSFVDNTNDGEEMTLTNQKVSKGTVVLDKKELASFMSCVFEKEIMKNLPISEKEIPKIIADEAKKITIKHEKADQKPLIAEEGGKTYAWIEKLLQTPIHDVRHRTVNIILAPYLVNIRGMDVDAAEKIIIEYIERCKAVNPATNVNESYIKYQCRYAKEKGLKPLSYEKAKELLSGVIDLGE